jgi:hypothetical protein
MKTLVHQKITPLLTKDGLQILHKIKKFKVKIFCVAVAIFYWVKNND